NRVYFKYLLWLYKQAHAVIYPSEFAKKMFAKINGDVEHIVISNGVDTGEFKKTDTKIFFDKFKLSTKDKKIFYVGRLHPEKSIETLIKSVPHIMKRQPDAHVYIAGFGHQDIKLKELTAKLNLAKNVTFLGKISEEDKIMAYNACDVFVLPSLAELEGMAVLEAMSCGKPIIVANSENSASTYFVDQNGFLFEPQNEKDLANKIIDVLSDENALNRMGKISFQKSRQYDINESVSKLENLYYSILNI
ncbi:MAG: glycosyltransferase, partial [Candidatus Azambacteria bacterium]|nr:glycosyltransferase [Candidatus Azambacteria bacterium]